MIERVEWIEAHLLQAVIDVIADPVFAKDRAHRWIACNAAFARLVGRPREALLGRSDPDLFPPEQAEWFWRQDDALFASDAPHEVEEVLTDGAGRLRTLWTRKVELRDADGRVVGLVGTISDITDLRARIASEREAIVRAKDEALDAMAVPVLEIDERVLLVPLVGPVSARRAEQIVAGLLDGIIRARASVVLIDLTGVPALDADSAARLLQAVAAARLLGARSILVGLGPQIAAALADFGVALGGVETRGRLRDGLALARTLR